MQFFIISILSLWIESCHGFSTTTRRSYIHPINNKKYYNNNHYKIQSLLGKSQQTLLFPFHRTYQKQLLFSFTKDRMEKIDSSNNNTNNNSSTSPSTSTSMNDNSRRIRRKRDKLKILNKATEIYVNYVTRLWRETNTKSRERIANQKAYHAIKHVQHLLKDGEEYVNIMNHHDGDTLDEIEMKIQARDDLLNACNTMLDLLGSIDDNDDEETSGNNKKDVNVEKDQAMELRSSSNLTMPVVDNSNVEKEMALSVSTNETEGDKKVKKKKSRSVLFGATMGAIVACWVFSGNFLFTALFTLMTILGQLEYYRMVMRVGIYPARKISVVGASAMFVTALFAPALHQICLPFFATYAMIWFLTMRRKVSTIPEIATTFTGMFYLGYIPSFWVRIRLIEAVAGQPETILRPFVAPVLDAIHKYGTATFPFLSQFIHSPITAGSVFIFWTWISIAFSDVGAYFMGRKYGKTKLGTLFPAAGAASPNKTIEGYLGGTLYCAAFATMGAWVMQWPYWFLTGPIHGIMLAFLGLVGDLTASMLKRDSGMKDFGDLLPEHGGIMDRVDSFVFTAPYSWLVCQFIIPALRLRSRLTVP